MRARVLGPLVGLLLLVAPPASAQWSPAGPFTLTQGTLNLIRVVLPTSVADFIAGEVTVRYADAVFEPLELLDGVFTFPFGTTMASPPDSIGGGMQEVTISLLPSIPPVALETGAELFGALFRVRPNAPLGDTTAVASIRVGLDSAEELVPLGDFDVTFTIAPVPEPGTWALMTAGLTLVVFAARRRSRRAG